MILLRVLPNGDRVQIGRTTTGAGGSYQFTNIPNGSYEVVPGSGPGFLTTGNNPEPVTIAGADSSGHDFGYSIGITAVLVYDFTAYQDRGAVVVEWKTASEVGTAGFYLYRWDDGADEPALVNEALLPAMPGAAQGSVYRLVDQDAIPSAALTYTLVEIEGRNVERLYGPFTVPTEDIGAREPMAQMATVVPRRSERSAQRRLSARAEWAERLAAPRSPVLPDGGFPLTKARTEGSDVYSLAAADLAALYGVAEGRVRSTFKSYRLRITNRGEPVAYRSVANGSRLYFHVEELDTRFTGENVYWFEPAADGLKMTSTSGGNPVAMPGLSFQDQVRFEEQAFPATAALFDDTIDFWFWDFLSAGNPTHGVKSFTLPVQGVAANGGDATLTLNVLAATEVGLPAEHHVIVRLNGIEIGDTVWDGQQPHAPSIEFSQSLLLEGDNTVELEAVLDGGVPLSVIYVDAFDLDYARDYRAVNDRLVVRGDGNPVITVAGFTSGDFGVLNITDPKRPVIVGKYSSDQADGFRVSFVPASPTDEYLVFTRSTAAELTTAVLDQPSDLVRDAGAEHVVITPPELATSAAELASYRGGLLVELEDVYDEFNFGIASPWAIRDFLVAAYDKWLVTPKYVVLAGSGTVDYRNYLGFGDSLMPIILGSTPYGLHATDGRFGDVVGDDGVPEISIGRIPALSESELSGYVAKLEAYEAGSGTWQSTILALADNADAAGNFSQDSDLITALFPPSFDVESIYLDALPVGDARAALLPAWDAGALLVNYVGHGGLDRLTSEGLLVTGDVAGMSNAERLPVVSALTCTMARFEVPNFDSLGEELVLAPQGGAIAVWGPTGLSLNADAAKLNEAFVSALFQDGYEVLGDAVLEAMRRFEAEGDFEFMLDIYGILGDPAIDLQP